MKLTYNNFENVFKEKWSKQKPLMDLHISKMELDIYIQRSKDELMKALKRNNFIGIQLFKNVFAINDLSYGRVCGDCDGNLILIHYDTDSLYKPLDLDCVVWLPSLESFAANSFELGSNEVLPISLDSITKKEVGYKCLSCEDSKWKYLKYDSIFGLTYSNEEIEIA